MFESDQPVTAIVPDSVTAEYIARCIPAVIDKIPGFDDGDARRATFTQAEKDKRSRADKYLYDLVDQQKTLPDSLENEVGSVIRSEGQNSIAVTFQLHKKATRRDQFASKTYVNAHALIKAFKKLSKKPVDSKDDCALFNPAIFKDVEVGVRRKVNFLRSDMIVLDFDNGSVSPEEFIKLFGEEAKAEKRSFLLCNSFRRSAEEPNRFRVMMFFREPANSIVEHQAVFDHIEQVLEEHGHHPSTSGLDTACRSGVQSFYVPCTVRGREDWYLFVNQHSSQAEVARYGVVPRTHVKKPAFHPNTRPKAIIERSLSDAGVEDLINQYHSMVDGRREITFDIAKAFAKSGCDKDETERRLLEVVWNAPHHRKNAPEIIRWLDERDFFGQAFVLSQPSANIANTA